MGACAWLVLVIVNEVAALLYAQQSSPCEVVQTDVFCNNKNLRSIPGRLPPGIQKLDLSRNLLQNLTHEVLSVYNTVHHLNLHSNKIHFIQPGVFRALTNLQVLDLSENNLDVFAALKTDVGRLPSVESLDLSGNGLYTGMSDYFLRDAPALKNLSLDGNSITMIDNGTFTGSSALRKIDLHNNVILEITEGAFEYLNDLSDLDLSMNSITCITDFNLCRLKLLNLSKNSLELFQAVELDREYELLYLDLRENKIPYFPILPKMSRLMYLDLSRNRLRDVNTSGNAEEDLMSERSFKGHQRVGHQDFSQLLYLDMSFNQIKSLPSLFFSSMMFLETLNVSNNCLEAFSVTQEAPLNGLKTLDLSFNALQELSFEQNTLLSLEALYLQGNYLGTADSHLFHRLPYIRELHLQQNYLRICEPHASEISHKPRPHGCVSLSSIPTLKYVSLADNSLRIVPQNAFRGSPVQVLDLSNNPGLYLHKNAFSGLETSLTHLSLQENHLHTLNTDLSFLTSLRVVNLSMNRLTSLPLRNKESSIELLNLQNNSLVTLEHNTLEVLERTLKTLYMGLNPLSCCSNGRFLDMVKGKPSVEIPDLASVTCQYTLDSNEVEINILDVVEDHHCKSLDLKTLNIVIIVASGVGLIVTLVVVFKLCHRRRRRHNSSFKA
ncbi:transforming growth factor beta activator LRRC32 [Engraulis encrasicolus]|uniref:transforming growth factor beta activator LRRC32 n=1 Tax=Engraulis encrasicolus TaxID=184585 RepID=UPI002FD4EE30